MDRLLLGVLFIIETGDDCLFVERCILIYFKQLSKMLYRTAMSVTIDSEGGGGGNMLDIMFEDCFVIKWYQYNYFKHM